MHILLDVDDVVLDTTGAVAGLHSERTGKACTREQVTEAFRMSNSFRRTVTLFYADPYKYAERVRPMPGVAAALDRIRAIHRVTLMSAYGSVDTTERKVACARQHMPQHSDITGVPRWTKHMYPADMMIDDQVDNLVSYRRTWPDAVVVCADAPWNRTISSGAADVRWPGLVDCAPGWPALADWLCGLT